MPRPEFEGRKTQGLFDNEQIISTRHFLRKEATESRKIVSIVRTIENAGPIMVIDPEEAYYDLENTLERVRIASGNGMDVMELGGSTDKYNEASVVIPQIRNAVEEVGGNTLLISFPGTGSQVIKGVDATFSLFLPQLDKVYRENPRMTYLIHTLGLLLTEGFDVCGVLFSACCLFIGYEILPADEKHRRLIVLARNLI